MALESLRTWAQHRVPIQVPEIAEIEVQTTINGLVAPENVEMVFLVVQPPEVPASLTLDSVPAITDDLSLFWQRPRLAEMGLSPLHTAVADDLHAHLTSPDSTDAGFALFGRPNQIDLSATTWLAYPASVNLFDPIKKTKTDGKAYGGEKAQSRTSSERSEASAKSDKSRCKHGLPRYSCATCAEDTSVRGMRQKKMTVNRVSRKTRTIDLFDLLLPFLQPPLETLLRDPLLFPPGRRPYDYQITGIRFLSGRKSALLGDEMGLGKTIQAIVAIQLLFRRGNIKSVLIVCPRSLLGVWEHELKKWAPELFVVKVRGTAQERAVLWQTRASVHLTTYETLRSDCFNNDASLEHRFGLVILDEAQKIKNPDAGVSRAVRQVQSQYRWALTGTPLENKLEDVIAIFDYLAPQLFRERRDWWAQTVKSMIQPHFLRRRTADVLLELPEKVTSEVWLDLTDEQREAYETAEYEGRLGLQQPGATRIHVFSLINELKQICNIDPASGKSCKVNYLVDQLDTVVDSGQKALVFSHFPRVTLSKLVGTLRPFSPALFDGTLSDAKRTGLIKGFQEEETPRVLLMSVQTGGVGLTLTRANHVFHFDHWWNPAVSKQAEGRAHRIGQQNTVFVYDLFASDTIEERIYQLLQSKQHLFDVVIDDLSEEYVRGTITDDELFGLFDLKPPGQTKQQGAASVKPSWPQRLKALQSISPRQFEQLIERLYVAMGYWAEVTPYTQDGGVDVTARKASPTGFDTVIIQCKHYLSGAVGEQVVRELIGTWQIRRDATHAVLATSGEFSRNAVTLAQRHRIQLIDGSYLLGLLDKHGLEPGVDEE